MPHSFVISIRVIGRKGEDTVNARLSRLLGHLRMEKCVDSFNSQPLVSDFVLSWVKFESKLLLKRWGSTFPDKRGRSL